MTSTISIRQATTSDIGFIAQFNQAMALETENKTLPTETIQNGVTRMIQQPAMGFYLVAEIQTDEDTTEVCGCLGITYEWSDWRNGIMWWFQSVYVQPEHRRKGVFRTMFDHVEKLARNNPEVKALRLYVMQNNLSGKNTYAALGMTDSGYVVYEKEGLN